jgi:CDP-alcohol phosphatidyltransferase-like enzyme
MSSRPPIVRPSGSREFVDASLKELAAGRWSAPAWGRFLTRCLSRSADQALKHRLAFLELTLLHAVLARGRLRLWPLISWLLAVTHLGLLHEAHRGMSVPNVLTVVRANLPAIMPLTAPSAAGVALVTDYLDGRLARALNRETAFGAYADPLADMVFWTWFAFRHESSRWVRAVVLIAGPIPGAAITLGYFVKGRTIDYPRPLGVRWLSAGFQCALALRAIRTVSAVR